MLLFSKPLDTGFGFFIQSWLHLCAYLFIYLFANLFICIYVLIWTGFLSRPFCIQVVLFPL